MLEGGLKKLVTSVFFIRMAESLLSYSVPSFSGEHHRGQPLRRGEPSRRVPRRLRLVLRRRMPERRRLPKPRRGVPVPVSGRIRGRRLLDQHRRVRVPRLHQRLLPRRRRQLHLRLPARLDWLAVSLYSRLLPGGSIAQWIAFSLRTQWPRV